MIFDHVSMCFMVFPPCSVGFKGRSLVFKAAGGVRGASSGFQEALTSKASLERREELLLEGEQLTIARWPLGVSDAFWS